MDWNAEAKHIKEKRVPLGNLQWQQSSGNNEHNILSYFLPFFFFVNAKHPKDT